MSQSPRDSHYNVIYADPPWTFATYSKKGKGRSPEAHYDCMSFEAICDIPVADWAAKNSILLMWVTDPLLQIFGILPLGGIPASGTLSAAGMIDASALGITVYVQVARLGASNTLEDVIRLPITP